MQDKVSERQVKPTFHVVHDENLIDDSKSLLFYLQSNLMHDTARRKWSSDDKLPAELLSFW